MFNDLIALFSGWYSDYIGQIRAIFFIEGEPLPEIWSAYVPWEQLIAAACLLVFICCAFKFLRSVLCKMF